MSLTRLAVRNLSRNRRRTAITLVALVVGVAAMVALRGFLVGQRAAILENQMLGNLGALQVHRAGYVENVLGSPLTMDMEDTPALRQRIAAVPGIAAVSPRIEFGAQLSTPDLKPPPDDGSELPEADRGQTSFLLMTAFDPALEKQVTPRRWEWVKSARGDMFTDANGAFITLNDDFAAGLKVPLQAAGAAVPPVEQQLAILAPDRDGSLNGENVMLSGTAGSATPNDRRVGYVPLGTAQRLLRMEGRVTEYAMAVAPGVDLVKAKQALQQALGSDYEVHTWSDRVPFVNDIVGTQDFVFGIISGIFLLVVLLGIVNAMLMSVLERVREIGTMLAVGLRRRHIVQLFLIEGVAIGIVGGLLGMAVGMAWVLYEHQVGIALPAPGARVNTILRPSVEAVYLARILLQATVGAAIASLWPAWRASKLKPVEALAHT